MRKVLLRALLFVFVIVPGGLVVIAAWMAGGAIVSASRADPRWQPRFRVLFWARLWSLVYRVPFGLSLAVLHNEGASTPRALTSREQDALEPWTDGDVPAFGYPVGDTAILRGPSVGAGQVLRVNVSRLWLAAPFWLRPLVMAPDVSHLAYVGYERAALWAHVKVLREAFVAAGHDLREAARRYNGQGEAAEAYADRAENFLSNLGDA